VRQNKEVSCPPKKGSVEMSWSMLIPTVWMETQWYRLRAEMYTTNGTTMTDFEGTVWQRGEMGCATSNEMKLANRLLGMSPDLY
jgi:hypothetical protein